MPLLQRQGFTPQEYLRLERQADEKHTYWDGDIFLMSGASRVHNLIVTNVTRWLSTQLLERPCDVYPSDMRVRIPHTARYVYPDVTVVCGEPQFEDAEVDTLLNPIAIVEVLSPSTESFDRGKKFDAYRTIPSLQDYVLVAHDEPHIYVYTRQPNNRWLLSEAIQRDQTVHLVSIDCQLALTEVYRKISFS